MPIATGCGGRPQGRALARLTERAEEFGLSKPRKGITDDWTALGSEEVAKWPEDEEALLATAAEKLDALWERLAGVPDALRPIFEAT
ncbi:MAG TPA: hypothetical protein VF796_31115 [Humisphaera sp.]